MTDEDAFLRAIQATPQDDAPRLVYADWLDERGDDQSTRKADYLRITSRLRTARYDVVRMLWETRLRRLASVLESKWLAAVSRLATEACSHSFELSCPSRWENLRATRNPSVRTCDACSKRVNFCNSIGEARGHARRGECVALNIGVARSPGDLDNLRRFTRDEVVMIGRLRTEEVREVPAPPPAPIAPILPEPNGRAYRLSRRRIRREPRRKRWTPEDE